MCEPCDTVGSEIISTNAVQDLIENPLWNVPHEVPPSSLICKGSEWLAETHRFFLGPQNPSNRGFIRTLHPPTSLKQEPSSYSSSSSSSSNNITKHYPSSYQPLKQRKKNVACETWFCNNVIVALLLLSPPPEIQNHGKMGRSKMTILYSCHIHSRPWLWNA